MEFTIIFLFIFLCVLVGQNADCKPGLAESHLGALWDEFKRPRLWPQNHFEMMWDRFKRYHEPPEFTPEEIAHFNKYLPQLSADLAKHGHQHDITVGLGDPFAKMQNRVNESARHYLSPSDDPGRDALADNTNMFAK